MTRRPRRPVPGLKSMPALKSLPVLKSLSGLRGLAGLAPLWPDHEPEPPPGQRAGGGRWLREQRVTDRGGRLFDVYLPAGLRRRTRAPMVLLLHGCLQGPAEFADASRFTTVADRNGLILVLPSQERRHHSRRCWHWYEALHQQRDSGEPALLAALTRQVAAESHRWRVDRQRVYVAGISAGGAMALVLATVYPDLFAAAGVHSAPPYRAATRGSQALAAMAARRAPAPPAPGAGPMAPLLVVQGTADEVVDPVNGQRIVEQWLAYRAAGDPAGRGLRSRTDRGQNTDGRGYTRVRWYSARRQRVLEYWLVQGLGHAWSGGRPGGSYSDPAGPRAATLMWGFFRGHRLPRSAVDPGRAAG